MHAIPTTSVAPSPGASPFQNAGANSKQTSPAAPQQVSNGDRSSFLAAESLEKGFFSPESIRLRNVGMERDTVVQKLADAKDREEVLRLNPHTAKQGASDRVGEDREQHPMRIAALQKLDAELEELNPSNDEISKGFALSFGFPS